MDIAENQDIPGIIMFIDYEKAFDYLEWEFITNTLTAMNFGPQLINMIKTLYTDIESCIFNNGHRSDFFTLSRFTAK